MVVVSYSSIFIKVVVRISSCSSSRISSCSSSNSIVVVVSNYISNGCRSKISCICSRS